MFESVKELLSARETLETVNEQIAESEARLQELQEQLKDAEAELAARNDTIAKKDDIVIAIHKQTTEERQKIVDHYDRLEKEAHNRLNQTEELLKKQRHIFRIVSDRYIVWQTCTKQCAQLFHVTACHPCRKILRLRRRRWRNFV